MRIISILTIFFFICRLASGQITFEKVFNKENNATGYSVIQTSDNGYAIAGGTGYGDNEKIYLVRTNAAGDTLWTRTFSGNLRYVCDHAILQTGDGGFIICGNMGDTIYLLKTNATGDSLWGHNVITGIVSAIEPTLDGGYILCGNMNGILIVKTDSSGKLQWNKLFQVPPGIMTSYLVFSIKQTQDTGFIVTGGEISGYGFSTLLLLKTDSNGDTLWMKTYGYIPDSRGYSVSIVADNGYFVCGTYQESGFGAFAMRLNEMGDTLWLRKINDPGAQFSRSCQTLPGGGFIICGVTEGDDNTDAVMLLKFSESGSVLWSKTFTWYDKSWGYCVRQTADKGYIITGNTTETTSAITDLYLIKTDSAGFIAGIKPTLSQAGMKVYPNPASNQITFRFDGTFPNDDTQITIYDLYGKKVVEEVLPKGQTEITMDIRTLAPGLYCYGITQNMNRKTGKLVIVK